MNIRIHWFYFDIAAKCEHKDAQYVLGVIYSQGKGTPKNFEASLGRYIKAAENGSVHACCNIGVCYRNGIGAEKSYKEALEWFTHAAVNGNID